MRTRLDRTERRAEILDTARRLVAERGLAGTEMEDIRLACGISRGGLYHHFANKRAVLGALVDTEVSKLAEMLEREAGSPIPRLMEVASGHLGGDPGILAGLGTREERLDYLSALDEAFNATLGGVLAARLRGHIRKGVDPGHLAELFLIVNAHINRREILGDWSAGTGAAFAATALEALAPLLAAPADLARIISDLKKKAAAP